MLDLQHLSCYYSIPFLSVLKLLLANFAGFSLPEKGKGGVPPVKNFLILLLPRKISPVDSTALNKVLLPFL